MLGLVDARIHIYIPAYQAAIANNAQAQHALQLLAAAARTGPVSGKGRCSTGMPRYHAAGNTQGSAEIAAILCNTLQPCVMLAAACIPSHWLTE